MKKAFFFDIDGTILPNGYKTPLPSTIYAINELNRLGHTVFIATGKNLHDAKTIGAILGVDNYMSTNGQTIYFEGKFLDTQLLLREDLEYWKNLGEEYNCAIGLQSDYDRYVLESEKLVLINKFFDIVNLEYPTVESELRDEDNINQLFIAGNYEKIKFDENKYKIVQWTEIGADILPVNASKGRAISMFLDIYSDYSETFAFGDGHNDLEMFSAVKQAIAMGNSHEEVKAAANHITTNDTDDGIYKFLVDNNIIKEQYEKNSFL
jgi:Cof subfamily protein (haloacid dehalogenase superfamily)